MEGTLLGTLGKIAGIGGIALGVFFLLYRGVVVQIGPLGVAETFLVLRSLMTFTFGIAGIGIISWLISLGINPGQPIPWPPLVILACLFVVVIGAAVYVGLEHIPQSQLPPQIRSERPIEVCMGNGGGQSCNGPGVVSYTCAEYRAIGAGGLPTYVALNKRFCNGGPETAQQNVRHNFSREGGECGWTSFTVTCVQ
jgi:hypothetical protein